MYGVREALNLTISTRRLVEVQEYKWGSSAGSRSTGTARRGGLIACLGVVVRRHNDRTKELAEPAVGVQQRSLWVRSLGDALNEGAMIGLRAAKAALKSERRCTHDRRERRSLHPHIMLG